MTSHGYWKYRLDIGMIFLPQNVAELFYGGRTRLWMRGAETGKWMFMQSCEGDYRLYGKDGILTR